MIVVAVSNPNDDNLIVLDQRLERVNLAILSSDKFYQDNQTKPRCHVVFI